MALPPKSPPVATGRFAQQQAAQQDVFLREVDEALRQDQALDAVRRYGKIVGAVVAVFLLALGSWLWWNAHEEGAQAARAEQLVLALDQLDAGRLDAAKAQIAPLAASGDDGSTAAARLLQAGIAQAQGQKDQAASLYDKLASDSATPQPMRDLATIRAVSLRFGTMKPEDVIARLHPLALPGNPWFGSAGELVGMAYLKEGHKDMAGPLFVAISRDKDLPDSLRARSRQMAGLLGFDAIDDIAHATAQAPDQGAQPAAPQAPSQSGPAPTPVPAAPAAQ